LDLRRGSIDRNSTFQPGFDTCVCLFL
jgi:hypothetical protein